MNFIENEKLSETEKILNLEKIFEYLPHRYPFIMIDKVKIDKLNPFIAVGYKLISGNDPFFQGHFPGSPIMPGVLIIESMAQTSCVLLLSKSGITGKLAYFMSIDKAKFRNPVTPGDILELHVEITRYNGKRGKAKGNAYVNKKKVAESEFAFIVVDKKRIE